MANINLRGKFQNNRRREANVVTITVPVEVEGADLREGKAPVTLAPADLVQCLDVPAGVIITSVYLAITTPSTVAASVKFDIGADALMADTPINAAGLTNDPAFVPLLVTDPQTIVCTMGGAAATDGEASLVVEYFDYTRATMSYIGEE